MNQILWKQKCLHSQIVVRMTSKRSARRIEIFLKVERFAFITLANSGENGFQSKHFSKKSWNPTTKNDREYDVYCKPPVQLVGMAVYILYDTGVYTKFCLYHSHPFLRKVIAVNGVLLTKSPVSKICEKLVRCNFLPSSLRKD